MVYLAAAALSFDTAIAPVALELASYAKILTFIVAFVIAVSAWIVAGVLK